MLNLSFPLASVTNVSIMKIPNIIKDIDAVDIQKIIFLALGDNSIIVCTDYKYWNHTHIHVTNPLSKPLISSHF